MAKASSKPAQAEQPKKTVRKSTTGFVDNIEKAQETIFKAQQTAQTLVSSASQALEPLISDFNGLEDLIEAKKAELGELSQVADKAAALAELEEKIKTAQEADVETRRVLALQLQRESEQRDFERQKEDRDWAETKKQREAELEARIATINTRENEVNAVVPELRAQHAEELEQIKEQAEEKLSAAKLSYEADMRMVLARETALQEKVEDLKARLAEAIARAEAAEKRSYDLASTVASKNVVVNTKD